MSKVLNFIPSMLGQIPAGIPVLVYLDRFICWDDFFLLIGPDYQILETDANRRKFLKIAFLKYTHGTSIEGIIEIIHDRISFQQYMGHGFAANIANKHFLHALETFVSPAGYLGELIALIDEKLETVGFALERKIPDKPYLLIPHLTSAKIDFLHPPLWH